MALEPNYTQQVEITFKSHVPLKVKDVERFLKAAMAGAKMTTSVSSPFRDTDIFIDDVTEPLRIK